MGLLTNGKEWFSYRPQQEPRGVPRLIFFFFLLPRPKSPAGFICVHICRRLFKWLRWVPAQGSACGQEENIIPVGTNASSWYRKSRNPPLVKGFDSATLDWYDFVGEGKYLDVSQIQVSFFFFFSLQRTNFYFLLLLKLRACLLFTGFIIMRPVIVLGGAVFFLLALYRGVNGLRLLALGILPRLAFSVGDSYWHIALEKMASWGAISCLNFFSRSGGHCSNSVTSTGLALNGTVAVQRMWFILRYGRQNQI